MTTKRPKRVRGREASKYLASLMGGSLTLGAALSGLREADEVSLALLPSFSEFPGRTSATSSRAAGSLAPNEPPVSRRLSIKAKHSL